MIDHTSIVVSDFQKSRAFYLAALAPIGYQMIREFEGAAGFGEPPKPDYWIVAGTPAVPPLHIAFGVRTHAAVIAFHAAALAAGGMDNGPPGLRPQYHPTYYAAFVIDPDGNNIEAVCHAPQ